MDRLTLDSNEYVAALVFGGKAKRVLQMGLEGKVRLFIADEILAETLRVLRDKFGFEPDDRLPKAEMYIKRCTERVVPAVKLEVVKADPDDDKILECAVHFRSEAIISEGQSPAAAEKLRQNQDDEGPRVPAGAGIRSLSYAG